MMKDTDVVWNVWPFPKSYPAAWVTALGQILIPGCPIFINHIICLVIPVRIDLILVQYWYILLAPCTATQLYYSSMSSSTQSNMVTSRCVPWFTTSVSIPSPSPRLQVAGEGEGLSWGSCRDSEWTAVEMTCSFGELELFSTLCTKSSGGFHSTTSMQGRFLSKQINTTL